MAEKRKEAEKMDAVTTASIVSSQAEYKGNSQLDRVKVTAIEDGKHVKKGKEYNVHPTTALILEKKGLIDDSWKNKVVKYQPSESGTNLQDKHVTKPEV